MEVVMNKAVLQQLQQTVSNIDAIIESNPYLRAKMAEIYNNEISEQEADEIESELQYEKEQHFRWFKW